MYEIKAWCFLCASDKNDVSVEINFLDESLRELIGSFSIINFALVSSQICLDCHGFLKEHERRRELYSKVESMYMEILKVRNKPAVDVRAIRAKHQIDNELPVLFKSRAGHEPESLVNIVQFEINEVEVEELIQMNEVEELTQTKEVEDSPPLRASQRRPKLLNPTLVEILKIKPWFQCDLCNYSSTNKGSLTKHIGSAHKRPTETSSKSDSKRRAVNRQLTKDFKCSNCPKTFASKGSWKEHEKTHLPVKSLACPICSKTFKTSSILSHHIDTHGNTEYTCPECGKILNTKRTLKMHQLTHSNVTKFACQFCKSQFKRAKDFKEHLIAAHTELKPYSCDWCPKKFSNGPNSRKHKREHHPEELEKAEKSGDKDKVRLPTIEELVAMIGKKIGKKR